MLDSENFGIIFIADLHLREDRPQRIIDFCSFLDGKAREYQALYLLGDIFHYWLGDDHVTPLIADIKTSIKNLTAAGTKVCVMSGNHDFLLGENFCKDCGATLLPDLTVINLYGVSTLLSHGDISCTQDRKFILLHKLIRNNVAKWLFTKLPILIRAKIALKVCALAPEKNKKPLIIRETIEKYLLKHPEIRQVIHAHTHSFTKTKINNCSVVSLPDWGKESGCLEFKNSDSFSIISSSKPISTGLSGQQHG